jgi:hypothetical protein
MIADKPELVNALHSSIRDLQQGVDRHCVLINSIMTNETDVKDLGPFLDSCPSRVNELALKKAIKDAIDTLEDTRKAFKSKKLEMLRKRLTQVLVDAG